MAFADDALDPVRATEIARYLENDEKAREYVEALRRSISLLRAEADAVARAEVPQRLIDAVLAPKDNVVRLGDRASRRSGPSTRYLSARYLLPLAASIIAVVGLAVLTQLPDREQQGQRLAVGLLGETSPLHVALNSQPSGSLTPLPLEANTPTGSLHVIGTYLDRANRPCREFEIVGSDPAGGPAQLGIACRKAGAGWVVVAAAFAPDAVGGAGDSYQPSTDHSDDPLGNVLDTLGAGQQLSHEDERRLIEQGWR